MDCHWFVSYPWQNIILLTPSLKNFIGSLWLTTALFNDCLKLRWCWKSNCYDLSLSLWASQCPTITIGICHQLLTSSQWRNHKPQSSHITTAGDLLNDHDGTDAVSPVQSHDVSFNNSFTWWRSCQSQLWLLSEEDYLHLLLLNWDHRPVIKTRQEVWNKL